jgi:hypothetical protein
MTSVASILNDFGIPWPDADSGKARDAAQAWAALGQAATDAMSIGGSAAEALSSHNTGPAMDAFGTYWASIGGPYGVCVAGTPHSMLPVLADACDALSAACTKFADAVDELKTKLEETAGEIAAALTAGALATVFTLGISDFVSGTVSTALIGTAFGAIEVFGTAVADILGQAAVGGVAAAVDSVLETTMTNGLKSDLGEPVPSASDELLSLVEGIGLGTVTAGLSTTAGLTVKAAATAALANLPDDVSTLAPDLPMILASIPDALETPAGKTLNSLASEYAANSGVAAIQGKAADAPTLPEILGELLDSKIEAAGEGEEGGEGGH